MDATLDNHPQHFHTIGVLLSSTMILFATANRSMSPGQSIMLSSGIGKTCFVRAINLTYSGPMQSALIRMMSKSLTSRCCSCGMHLLMRQIYQKADRVVVDLGDVSLEWYSVFDMMKELNMSRRLSNRTVSDGST